MQKKEQHPPTPSLGALKINKKSGKEPFVFEKKPLSLSLMDFWQWSQSDLLGNALRGVLAEFIVAAALDLNTNVRTEWDAVDFITPKGLKIEVKSSAYLQSWKQDKLSDISFNIAPTKGWFAETNEYADRVERQADVYVFCLLHHTDQDTVNPLDLDQWSFYVLATSVLNEKRGNQQSINLNSLLKLNPRQCTYKEIKAAVEEIERLI
jgi:hypothetical protein